MKEEYIKKKFGQTNFQTMNEAWEILCDEEGAIKHKNWLRVVNFLWENYIPPNTEEVKTEPQLIQELTAVINAGNKLATALHQIQSEYDGIHRGRLALSYWYKVRANEFGREVKLTEDK